MTPSELIHFLKALPLFSGINAEQIENALEGAHVKLLQLAAGESPPSECQKMLGVVLSGSLLILSADETRSVVLRTLGKGDIFGAASLFAQTHAPLSRLKAKAASHLLFFDRDAVHEMLCADPAFMDSYLCLLADRIAFLNSKIRAFTARSTERRLTLWLTAHENDGFVRNTKLSTLADALDIGRASLYRALDKLEDEGLILRNGRDICLLAPDELMQKYHS
jgi:CRP-like cAMP-binding protein